jgi:DnaK suppressor protein
MTKIELIQFRKKLEAMEVEVQHRVHLERSEILIENGPDVNDDVWSIAGRDVALINLARDSSLLRNIRSALERIKNRTFGKCLNCEATISQKRLAALAWTRFCIRCQQELDGNPEYASLARPSASLLSEGDEAEVAVSRNNR